jgi:acyl-CoA thioester hydrolase
VTQSGLPREGALSAGVHRFPIRVYYEDTDAAGIVYYANYLKFVERARTEMMRMFGVEHERWRQAEGTAFIVRHAALDYLAPARLDDELVVETRVKELGGASILLDQDIKRDDTLLVRSTIRVACVGRNGRPVRLPSALRAALLTHSETFRMVTAHAR